MRQDDKNALGCIIIFLGGVLLFFFLLGLIADKNKPTPQECGFWADNGTIIPCDPDLSGYIWSGEYWLPAPFIWLDIE